MALHGCAMAMIGHRHSIRLHISLIVAVILIPALIIAGWIASRSAASERIQIEQNLDQKAREIISDIDREIDGVKNLLTALASSHFLQIDDIEAFYKQAKELSQQVHVQFVLRSHSQDERLMNTVVPLGVPPPPGGLPQPRYEAEQQLLRTGKPTVSNVFRGPTMDQFVVSVLVLVKRDNGNSYVLSAGIPTSQFATILEEIQLGPGRVAAVLDRNNRFVTRSEKHQEFTGTAVVGNLPPAGKSGVVKATNRDGTPFCWFFRRSAVTGWVIAVGVAESVLEAPSNLALLSYSTAGSLLFVVAIGLSFGLGGRIPNSISALGIDRQPTREEFRVLFEHAPNGEVVVDSDGRIALTNAQMNNMFGYGRDELIGMPVEMLVPERFRAGHAMFRRAFAAKPLARPMGERRDLYGRRQDGSEFPIEVGLNPIHTRAGDFTMATIADITARVLAAERLSATIAERDHLRRRFLQAQEEERLRLARELHDQTGQSLTAAMLELKSIEPLVEASGRDRLRSLRKQLEQMGKSLHHVALELRPASIDELEFSCVLANYVSEWSAQYGIDADFHCRDPHLDELSDEIRTTTYRVIQEALTNIAKHATGARTASVILDRTSTMLQLTIENDGSGFDPDAAADATNQRKRRGLGLAGMRERLSLLGGDLMVESSPGGGTTIFARIPLGIEGPAV